MKKFLLPSLLLSFFLFLLAGLNLSAASLELFVASSASKAFNELKTAFLKTHPNDEIKLVFGATGKFYQLFSQGREFDLFFGADAKYAEQIAQDGNALAPAQVYALGALALYSLDEKVLAGGLEKLGEKAGQIKHLAIANAKVAPYGVAAEQALARAGLEGVFAAKLVRGENISVPVAQVDTGAAEVGIVAYSLVSPTNKPRGQALLIDEKYFEPLRQSFIITKYAKDKPLALEFAAFVTGAEGRKIIEKYGFALPQKEKK